MTDDLAAISGEHGGYVPCDEQASAPAVSGQDGAAVYGSDAGFVPVAAGVGTEAPNATDANAVFGKDTGFVAKECCEEQTHHYVATYSAFHPFGNTDGYTTGASDHAWRITWREDTGETVVGTVSIGGPRDIAYTLTGVREKYREWISPQHDASVIRSLVLHIANPSVDIDASFGSDPAFPLDGGQHYTLPWGVALYTADQLHFDGVPFATASSDQELVGLLPSSGAIWMQPIIESGDHFVFWPDTTGSTGSALEGPDGSPYVMHVTWCD